MGLLSLLGGEGEEPEKDFIAAVISYWAIFWSRNVYKLGQEKCIAEFFT